MPFQVLYLTGPPASGKSTLTHWLTRRSTSIQAFIYGEVLTKWVGERGAGFLQDDLRTQSSKVISAEDVRAVDRQLLDFIAANRDRSHIVIDSHAVTKEAYGYRVVQFSSEMLAAAMPTMVCMLYAESQVITGRISRDAQGRPSISSHEADLHTNLQAAVALSYGFQLGVPVYFMDSARPVEELGADLLEMLGARLTDD